MLYIESLTSNPKVELAQENLNRVIIRRVEHLYFKVFHPDSLFTHELISVTAVPSGQDI